MVYAREVVAPCHWIVCDLQRSSGVCDSLANLVVLPCMPFHPLLTSLPTNEESVLILEKMGVSLVVCDCVHYLYPDLKITVVGRNK